METPAAVCVFLCLCVFVCNILCMPVFACAVTVQTWVYKANHCVKECYGACRADGDHCWEI